MGDHLAKFAPGAAVTYTASVAITGGQLVYVSGNRTVAPTTAATAAWIGVAAFDAPVGAKVTIESGGIHELASTGAIAAGVNVIPGAAGVVVAIGAVTDYSQVVGVAIAAAASNKVLVKLSR